MSDILSVENLTLSIATGHIIQGRKTILNNISFNVEQGKATAYLGANGAGKTSTFRILCGLTKADTGRVVFKGKDISNGLPCESIGFMPEQPYFYKNLSPFELLRGLGALSGISGLALNQRIKHWAEKLDFANVLKQSLSACSKGQVQRVGLAQALMHEPEFILLDEPLSGLDPIGRELVRNVLHETVQQGATLLFSSHILDDAESICEHVIVLNQGEIAYHGTTSSLVKSGTKWVIRFEGEPLNQEGLICRKNGATNHSLLLDGEHERDQRLRALLDDPTRQIIAVEQDKKTLESAFVELLRKGNNA